MPPEYGVRFRLTFRKIETFHRLQQRLICVRLTVQADYLNLFGQRIDLIAAGNQKNTDRIPLAASAFARVLPTCSAPPEPREEIAITIFRTAFIFLHSSGR